ncbi:hypothetical protein BS50DRAFT_633537 [Corynespora cassiicola Philippines]|uniref:DUF202 domain-containing protein n=1 Tax=Corynespora cassiicola Philippines TaxID=1448308 RepID=A0A2T2NR76_CORCC|nr:hypothetical protein BS50DRAFT_633537 [Corynespora cassiicola Philippines]
MFEGRHAADRYQLRLHRARSVVLSSAELVEIRAAQRTFEGAYIRTAIGQFSFALIVLKIFTAEFYSIGALFAVYGAGVLFTSLFRRKHGAPANTGLDYFRLTKRLGNKQFFSELGEDGLHRKRFRTSGNVVSVLTALSMAAYICLLVLTLRLGT